MRGTETSQFSALTGPSLGPADAAFEEIAGFYGPTPMLHGIVHHVPVLLSDQVDTVRTEAPAPTRRRE